MKIFSRRDFVKSAAALGMVSVLPKYSFSQIGKNSKIKIAIVGCGRGGKKLLKCAISADKNIEIVSIADAFEDCAIAMKSYIQELSNEYPDIDKIKPNNIFFGLDAYKNAIDSGADLVILASPPVFRSTELDYAINANKHILAEKPICVEASQARKVYELAGLAKEKSLTAICGFQRRFHNGYKEAIKRIHDGQIGEIVSAQAYWYTTAYQGQELSNPNNLSPEELEYQLRNWMAFIWTSGDSIVEQHVHSIDILNWAIAKDPLEVSGLGGRALDLSMPEYGNRFSHFAVDYDYGQDLRVQAMSRQEPKTTPFILEKIIGTKGVMTANLYGRQQIHTKDLKWEAPQFEDPSITQFRDLFKSIKNSENLNTLKDAADSSLMAIAGRISAYSGKKFKYKWVKLRSNENFLPEDLKFGKKAIEALPIPGNFKLS